MPTYESPSWRSFPSTSPQVDKTEMGRKCPPYPSAPPTLRYAPYSEALFRNDKWRPHPPKPSLEQRTRFTTNISFPFQCKITHENWLKALL